MMSSPTTDGLSTHRRPARSGAGSILSLILLLGATGCPPPSSSQQNGSGGSSDGGGAGNTGSGGVTGSGGHGSGGLVGSGGSTGSTGGRTGTGGSATGGAAGVGAAGGRTGSGGVAGPGTGGNGTAGSSAGGASAASGGTGAGGSTASCTDGIQNGNEAGVDCGGSCMTTCVTYKTGMPNSDGNVKNACESGGTGFICPRFMMFSPEMKQAAADDAKDNGWPAGSFNYAVVTLNGAKCCECYQIVYSTLQNGGLAATPPKAVIGQNFNQGGANNAFDVFMGKGGEGAQTMGCSKMYSSYPSIGEPNGGGITASSTTGCTGMGASLSSQDCVTAIENACEMIKANSSYVQQTTQTSCIESNQADSLYHENWNVKAQRIECPQHLTEVTGCRLNAQNLPKADPTIQTASQASGWSSYGTTTMQDCCKPSCAWPTNVSNTQGGWSTFYQCSMDGTPMTK